MQVMYETDVTPAIISRVMQTVRDKKGRKGRILTRNIVNAKQKYRREMDLLLKISPDWSVAQKTIGFLEANNISYYALIMDKSDHIFAQQGKGRPSKRRSEELRLHGELTSEIRRLRKAMAMKPGTDLLLAVSIATTDMQRAVSMFPEVYFMTLFQTRTNKNAISFFSL